MPGARKLNFGDSDFESFSVGTPHLMLPETDVWDALHHIVLQPTTGYHAKTYDLELPNYRCVVDVIDAVRSAGALLHSIDINLSTLGCRGGLVSAPDLRQEFASGLQQLKKFAFTCEDGPNEEYADPFNEFLSACLDTSSLRNLRLDMRYGENARTARIDVGRILGSKLRHNLTDIFLGRVAIDLSKLVVVLKRLPEPMRSLSLENVILRSGTWKEALDVLRNKRSRVKLFRKPQGAECNGMSDEHYERIFGEDYPKSECRSEAEIYIEGLFSETPNPLQALEDELDVAN
jgi:hypothetical protein